MIEIVREWIERPDAFGGFVLDGFPRTVAQAAALDRIMDGRDDALIVIDIAVPEAELVRRLGFAPDLRGLQNERRQLRGSRWRCARASGAATRSGGGIS